MSKKAWIQGHYQVPLNYKGIAYAKLYKGIAYNPIYPVVIILTITQSLYNLQVRAHKLAAKIMLEWADMEFAKVSSAPDIAVWNAVTTPSYNGNGD